MATRDAEKVLMKELERAVKDADVAQDKFIRARASFDAEQTRANKAIDEVNAIAGAVAALQGGNVEARRTQIILQARENASKEKPVA